MQLREHPSICRNGKPGWPPQWFKIEGAGNKLTGEIGTLSSVLKKNVCTPSNADDLNDLCEFIENRSSALC